MHTKAPRASSLSPATRLAPTRLEALANVVLVLGAHAALALYWLAVLASPLGPWLVWLAPVACMLHQQAMSEWLHEAAHWNFLPSRAWNDRVIQALAGTLFFDDIEERRRAHFTHHERDEAGEDLAAGIFHDLTGRTALSAIVERSEVFRARPLTRARRQARVVTISVIFYAALAVLLAQLAPASAGSAPAWLVLPVYLITLATLHPAARRLRSHGDLREPVKLEHQKHPTLPFRQLARLTAREEEELEESAPVHAPSRLRFE